LVEEADHVARHVQERVLLDTLRPVGLAVAAHVGSHRPVARGGERRQLMAPRIPGFGETVTEEDERTRPLLGDVHADAVGLDGPVQAIGHAGTGRGQTWAGRSTRPRPRGSGDSGIRPSWTTAPPFTKDHAMPRARCTSRGPPSGRSWISSGSRAAMVSGSNPTRSAASPGRRRPRSVKPNTSAGTSEICPS